MNKIIVAGIDTDVGKTLVSAILTTCLQGEYWKPIQCGDDKDSDTIKKWMIPVHESVYSLKAPLSPHHAARLENTSICMNRIVPPITTRPLIIESAGGIFVPLNNSVLSFDVFKNWNASWVIVSRHYLGSINHTLLTIDTLKRNNVSIAGIIFNGKPCLDSEDAILEITKIKVIGRLLPEPQINFETIQRYAKQWNPQL